MITILDLVLRLLIWLLLTADLSPANIMIGMAIAFLLPKHFRNPGRLKDWLLTLRDIIIAIPQAYLEAFEIMFRPHLQEKIVLERVKSNRTPGLIFLDIFLITFTPKTIALKYHENGWYEVHQIQRESKS